METKYTVCLLFFRHGSPPLPPPSVKVFSCTRWKS